MSDTMPFQDCNGDRLVTCDDYMMLHKNGGWNCGTNLRGTPYANIFNECKEIALGRGFQL